MAEAGAAGLVALGLDLIIELVRWFRGRRKRLLTPREMAERDGIEYNDQ